MNFDRHFDPVALDSQSGVTFFPRIESLVFPVFHAFTGCDTVAHFSQLGKVRKCLESAGGTR